MRKIGQNGKFTKSLSVVISALIVLSLVPVIVSIQGVPVSASPGPTLVVTITPDNVSENICENVLVTVEIANTGDAPAENVKATVTIPTPTVTTDGCASLENGELDFGDIDNGKSKSENWVFHCRGPGVVTITVGATSDTAGTTVTEDTLTLNQPLYLVSIERPVAGEVVENCDNFYVNATVANVSGVPIREEDNVDVTITIDGKAEVVEGENKENIEIPVNEAADFWWKLHCTGEGVTTITVTVSENDNYVHSDEVTIWQEVPDVLVVEIEEPTPDNIFCECQNFVVKAFVKNISDETYPPGIIADNVKAKISISGCASLVYDNENKELGKLDPGKNTCVSWNLHCDALGTVQIDVGVTGKSDGSDISGEAIENDYVYISQENLGVLSAYITAPEEGSKICTKPGGVACNNEFTISATVWNDGCRAVTGAKAELKIDIGEENIDLTGIVMKKSTTPENIPPGGYATVSWEGVKCTGEGDVTFHVEAEGWDAVGDKVTYVSATRTIHQVDVLLEIIEVAGKTPDGDITVSTWQDFDVTARVTNCTGASQGPVNVTLETEPPVGMENKSPATQSTDSLCPCCKHDFTWTLHCLNSTDGYVKVSTTLDGKTYEDNVLIKQQCKPHLIGGIEVFPGWMSSTEQPFSTTPSRNFYECQNFTLVVPVVNLGEATATDVSVTVNVTGPVTENGVLTKTIGSIPGLGSGKAIWELHCENAGEVSIEVPSDAGIVGKDANTGVAIDFANIVEPCPITLTQIALPAVSVEIIQPENCENFTKCQEFCVKAKITNNSTIDIKGLTATVSWTPLLNASLILEEAGKETRILSDIPPGGVSEVGWTLHCDGIVVEPGDVTITVTLDSTDPKMSVPSDPVTVHQREPPVLEVLILSPDVGTFIATSQEFAITAQVLNSGGETATDATATLDIPTDRNLQPYASLVEGETATKSLDNIDPDETVIVSWTVHADSTWLEGCSPENAEFEVWADATNAENNFDNVTVPIYPAAHLVVKITDYPTEPILVCDNFDVTATITNTGQADAWEVSAILSVFPEGSARVTENGYTKYIGTLVGHAQDDSAEVTWNIHCKEACESTITITAAGYDECGNHLKQSADHHYELVPEPGREIPDRFIEPDSITVKQVEEITPEPVDNTIDLDEGWNLISLMLIPDDDNIENVLSEVMANVGVVWAYDAETESWTSYDPDAGYNPLQTMEDGKGYWINMEASDTLTVYGSEHVEPGYTPRTYDVYVGWNLIGFKETTIMTRSEYLGSADLITDRCYEGAAYNVIRSSDYMTPGYGYWLAVTENGTIYP